LQEQRSFLHLQASDLIKAEQARRRASVSSSEELRLGPVLDNQQLLVDGFVAATQGVSGLVIFDGHAVIFGAAGATEIPSTVFGALGCAAIVMIEAEPATIRARRQRDIARARPDVDEITLGLQQALAKTVAAHVAADLAIPFHCVGAGSDTALAVLAGLLDGEGDNKCDA
jgi:adenylate kinase